MALEGHNMQIFVATVVKFLVDFFKDLLAKLKLQTLEKDLKEKKNEAIEQTEQATNAANDFLSEYEFYELLKRRQREFEEKQFGLPPESPIPEREQPVSDTVRPTIDEVRDSSERTEGSNNGAPKRTRSERVAAYRAEKAAKRGKGGRKKG
jgi:hypothetical protein